MSNTFGKKLRLTRKNSGKTLADVAAHLGYSVPHISDIERGQRSPLKPNDIKKAADFLEVDDLDLQVAAAIDRDCVHCDFNALSSKAQKVAIDFMRLLDRLTPDDLEQIDRILRHRRLSQR